VSTRIGILLVREAKYTCGREPRDAPPAGLSADERAPKRMRNMLDASTVDTHRVNEVVAIAGAAADVIP
jgi:hypothetical protein